MADSNQTWCKNHILTYVSCKDGETLWRCESCMDTLVEYHDTGCGG